MIRHDHLSAQPEMPIRPGNSKTPEAREAIRVTEASETNGMTERGSITPAWAESRPYLSRPARPAGAPATDVMDGMTKRGPTTQAETGRDGTY